MSGNSPSPAHGSAPQPCREHVTVRICAGRGRAHRYIIGFNRPSTTNLARTPSAIGYPFDSVIAGLSSLVGVNWRTAIEATRTLKPLAVRRFLQTRRDRRSGFCDLCRHPAFTAGKCFSSVRTLIKPLQKSLGVLRILFSPFHSAEPLCLGLIARSDGHRVAKGNGYVRHETGQR